MKLFPAVDILDGRAVRLLKGKRDCVTDYGDPVENALKWVSLGAKHLHIVDLNSAFDNTLVNEDVLKIIAREAKAIIELGGGMRTIDRIDYALDTLGFDRAIIGSAIVTDSHLLELAGKRYGKRIVAGLDAINNKLAIRGWVEQSDVTPLSVALRLRELGIEDIVYTDISKDGALSGVNVDATVELGQTSGLNIIASGGVSTLNDLKKLSEKKVYGAILGKAIYSGAIDLKEALCLQKE